MYAELREGTRTVGGQKLRYKDVLKRNLKAAGGHVHDWEELARDRNKYREMCREAISKVEQQRRDNYTCCPRTDDITHRQQKLQCNARTVRKYAEEELDLLRT